MTEEPTEPRAAVTPSAPVRAGTGGDGVAANASTDGSTHLKSIGVVSALTMVSRVLGLVRERVTAGVFGTGALISAFVTGYTFPNLFRRLLAEGGLTAALVPTLNHQLETNRREGAFRLINQVTSWLLVVTGGVVVLSMILFSQDDAIRFFGHLFKAEPDTLDRWLLAARYTVRLFPYLLFVSLAAAFSAALQSLHRFLEPALSPIWLNVSIIGLLLTATFVARGNPEMQVNWLTAGWLIGGFLQMAVPALALMNEGWRPRLDFEVTDSLRSMVRLMVPTLFSSSVYLINMSTVRLIGLSLNDQAVSVLNYAQRLMELPIGVFAVAISTVVFPLISRYAAAGDTGNLASAYRKGMRLILVINIPAAIGLGILAKPIIRLILQNGQFGQSDTSMMAPVLVANALGLPFLSFAGLALRAFYAQRNTVIPVRAAILSFLVNIGVSIALMNWLSFVGLAIASSVAAAAQAAYLQWHLTRKQEGLAFRYLVRDLGKVSIAAVLMGAVVGAGWWSWRQEVPSTFWYDALGISVMIVTGVVVYCGLVWFLRVEGRDEFATLWAKIRRRFV